MRANDLTRFIIERDAIRVKKEQGKPRPWTRDPILDRYRFCNVHREDDAVTKWLRQNWYSAETFGKNPDVWFAAIVARLFNNPESLEAIRKHVLPFDPYQCSKILQQRVTRKQKNFNAAYIVSTNGLSIDKIEYVLYNVLNVIWGDRATMRPKPKDTLDTYHRILMSYDGLGSFIAAQVVADLKYLPPLKFAGDWHTFAASGPGSRRGLNRVMGYDPHALYSESTWRMDLAMLQGQVNKRLIKADWVPLHAQDLQNCLCEFDKYERARLGEGTPKQIYKEKE